MQLVIFNGSPRKAKSNSTILIKHFSTGYHDHTISDIPVHYLATTSKIVEQVQAFDKADTVIIIFPLYTDAMPGQVKFFIESLAQLNTKGKNLGFIVQSGFPEAYHSIFIERYLKKLSKRLQCNYLGTVIKGGVEGIQIMPPSMTKKLFQQFEELGSYFAATGSFKPNIVKKLRKPYRMSFVRRQIFNLLIPSGLTNFYWNKKLKENNAYKLRFAQPYTP
jgi:NAD(P)H-dependent FMN reductase